MEITKDQLKLILQKAPAGSDPKKIIKGLQGKGYTIEGLVTDYQSPAIKTILGISKNAQAMKDRGELDDVGKPKDETNGSVLFNSEPLFRAKPREGLVSKAVQGVKSAVLKGGEGVQKVGAAITGDTSSLEGYRQFYGLKTPEEIDVKKLDASERGQLVGEGLVDFSTGALGAPLAPVGAAIESVPVVGEPIAKGISTIISGAGKYGVAKPVEFLAESLGFKLSDEQKQAIEQGGETVAGLFALKIAQDAAKIKETANLSNKVSEALKKGDLEAAKTALAQYEQAVAVKPTTTGIVGETIASGVAQTVKPLAEAVKTLGKSAAEMAKEAVRKPIPVEEIVGKITQGKTKDVKATSKALSDIDTSNVKTYRQLEQVTKDRIQEIATKQDELLLSKAELFKPKDVQTKITVERTGETIKSNPVQDAIGHLEEYYKSNPQQLAEIKNISAKFKQEGLSLKEMNDLARLYNTEFGKKAFTVTGEPKTGVSAIAYENTRKGIKQVVRDNLGDDVLKAMDSQISNLYKLDNLANKMVEKVNTLSQKIEPRTFMQKLGRGIAVPASVVLDRLGIQAFITKLFLKSDVGVKSRNSLAIEEMLSKNLEKLNEISKMSKTKAENAIVEMAKEKEAKGIPLFPIIQEEDGEDSSNK